MSSETTQTQADDIVRVKQSTLIGLHREAEKLPLKSRGVKAKLSGNYLSALKVAAWSLMKPDLINLVMIFAPSTGESLLALAQHTLKCFVKNESVPFCYGSITAARCFWYTELF